MMIQALHSHSPEAAPSPPPTHPGTLLPASRPAEATENDVVFHIPEHLSLFPNH